MIAVGIVAVVVVVIVARVVVIITIVVCVVSFRKRVEIMHNNKEMHNHAC